MKFQYLKKRAFVEVWFVDHTETGDYVGDDNPGSIHPEDVELEVCCVRGQVITFDARKVVIEGSWRFVALPDAPVEHNIWAIALGAVHSIRPLGSPLELPSALLGE